MWFPLAAIGVAALLIPALLFFLVLLYIALAHEENEQPIEPGIRREYVPEKRALGIVVDGEPTTCYGPGLHRIRPLTTDGELYHGPDWSLVRFTTAPTTWTWVHETDDTRVVVEATVNVTDWRTVWRRSGGADRPVRRVLGRLLRDATADGTDRADLDPGTIDDRIDVEYGLTVEELSVETAPLASYDIETIDGAFVRIVVTVDGAADLDPTGPEVRTTLGRLIDDATSDGNRLSTLDAKSLDEYAGDDTPVEIHRIERIEPDDLDRALDRTTVRG